MRMLGMSTALMIVVAGGVLAVPPVAQGAAPRTCHGHGATIVGTNRGDVIDGTPGRDVILGLGGDDVVRGRGGNDVICGKDGGDKLMGGAGDDRVYGGYNGLHRNGGYLAEVGDTISGGRGNDLLDPGDDPRHRSTTHIGQETLSYAHSASGVHLDLAAGTATGEGHDRIVRSHLISDQRVLVLGSPHDDVIEGTAGRDLIDPLDGNDTVLGRGGHDQVQEHAGANGNDRFIGGAGADTLTSFGGHDVLRGGGGIDFLHSTVAVTRMFGGHGDDSLTSSDDVDQHLVMTMHGGAGDDLLGVGHLGDGTVVDGGSGWDKLFVVGSGSGAATIDLAGLVQEDGSTITVHGVEYWILFLHSASIDVLGTGGSDRVRVYTYNHDARVTGSFGAGADRFSVRQRTLSVTVRMGAGDDRFFKGNSGAITASLGRGDDLVETIRGVGPIGNPAPSRTFDGGPGIDTANLALDIPNNTCTSIERGNCP